MKMQKRSIGSRSTATLEWTCQTYEMSGAGLDSEKKIDTQKLIKNYLSFTHHFLIMYYMMKKITSLSD